jgi:flavodoxin
MNIQIRHLSKGGNTKKVAEAIAEVAGVAAQTISEPVPAETDLLFLGGAVYAFGIDEELARFIGALNPSIRHAAVFSTTAVVKSAYPHIKKALDARGIAVLDEYLNCRGEFTVMHKGRPNAGDLGRARDFAHETIERIGGNRNEHL